MTLPFNNNINRYIRKYTCFICGKTETDFDLFKNHIIDNHEEGRDFITCPLKRCAAPVRCLKSHFKAVHKNEPIPKTGQLRALIWRNFHGEKLKYKKPHFRNGSMTSMKNNGKEMHYRSGMECEVYECLEVIPDVISYDVEPIKEGIPYLYKGEKHNYFPDLKVYFSDGHAEVWEIKPYNQCELEQNTAKWSAAKPWCEARNWDFIVCTEEGLEKLKRLARLKKS